MITTHDALYTPPIGRGFNADDLAAEQLKQIDKIFEERLPALVELGTAVFVEELRQAERMTAFETKMRESLSPEHMSRAREVFKTRAVAVLKAEAAAKIVETQTAAIVAAEARIQSEKRQNRR